MAESKVGPAASRGGTYAPETDTVQERLRRAQIGLMQIKQYLDTAKVGTPEYNKYKQAYVETQAEIEKLNKEDNAQRAAAQQKTASGKRQKLVEALTRAEDYGSPEEKRKAQAALDAFDNKNPAAAPAYESAPLRYGPNGESLVPGTPEYEKGSPTKPVVSKAPSAQTPASGTKSGTGAGGADKGKAAADAATKTAWISYLQTTFKTLPKDQKDQIDKLLATAQSQVWDEATFTEALKGTKWWQTTLPTLRQFFLETHDPREAATFAQKLNNQIDSISAKLETLGIRAQQVDPVTGKFYDNQDTIKGIAMDAIKNGWNDNQLLQHLADNSQVLFTGGGTIGSAVDNIKKQALMYGIKIDDNYLRTIQQSLLDPTDSRDQVYYMNEMKNQAIDLYKPFADSIKAGRSLYEVTNSYRNQMSQLLEVDPSNISWQDLMGKVVDKTTGNARTFADFTKQVKQDPLWQYTKNAKETYSNMALDLMKQFGFMG